ncbi:SPNS1-like protein [Mya arenaria]|uniref:SPNS1-like protein n=1 Tax=Mya arenaria TaxID=6604 RepID=A0ABY7E152_MYAAR|nr:SPNS1-like protein [Mya arenaria]
MKKHKTNENLKISDEYEGQKEEEIGVNMSNYDSNLTPPFDDSVQLSEMQVDVSDDLPIDAAGGDMELPEVEIVENTNHISTKRGYVIVAILFFINLLNYMDRFTIAGVLKDIQDYYKINNSEDGLLQTAFISFYMVFSPIFGYMGDRFNRKIIMAGGIFFWSIVTLAGSFVPADYFWGFILMRGMVGVGEASYSTIAPTLIADLFTGGLRTRMLMVFYFAIPVGSGLGYIVTPLLGIVCVGLILILVREPVRGGADGAHHLVNTSFFTDLKEIAKNKSFMLSSFGFTCVAFTVGALALWAPIFMQDAMSVLGHPTKASTVSFIFGGITVAAGFIGVAIGAESSRRYKLINPRADPLICAMGLLVLIFFGEVALCLNWAIIADILLYVVIPTRRSTAEAVQILMSHLLGDAGSPYLIGVMADGLSKGYKGNPSSPAIQFVALQQSLLLKEDMSMQTGADNPAFDDFVNSTSSNHKVIIFHVIYNIAV